MQIGFHKNDLHELFCQTILHFLNVSIFTDIENCSEFILGWMLCMCVLNRKETYQGGCILYKGNHFNTYTSGGFMLISVLFISTKGFVCLFVRLYHINVPVQHTQAT